MDQEKTKKITIYFVIFTIFLVLVLALAFRPEIFDPERFFGQADLEGSVIDEGEKFSEDIFFDGLPESEAEDAGNDENSLLQSENFKIKQISFGGSAVAAVDGSEEVPVKISDLQSEALLSEDNKEAKLLLSWETNKDSISTVEYSRAESQGLKMAVERKYNHSHRMLLSELDPGTVYVYRIKSRDRWGREFFSEYYSVYSGSPAVSVFDLISKSMNEIFGWAIKK